MSTFPNLNLWSLQPHTSIRIILVHLSLLRIPIVLGTVSPELRQANTEITVQLSLVPVDDIFNLITLCVVAYNQTLVIRRALVHHLTEELKGGEGRPVVLIDTLSVIQIRLT